MTRRSKIQENNVTFLYAWCWKHISGMVYANYIFELNMYELYTDDCSGDIEYFEWLKDNGYDDSEEMQKDFCRNSFEMCGFSDEIVDFVMSAWDKELDPAEVKKMLSKLEEEYYE